VLPGLAEEPTLPLLNESVLVGHLWLDELEQFADRQFNPQGWPPGQPLDASIWTAHSAIRQIPSAERFSRRRMNSGPRDKRRRCGPNSESRRRASGQPGERRRGEIAHPRYDEPDRVAGFFILADLYQPISQSQCSLQIEPLAVLLEPSVPLGLHGGLRKAVGVVALGEVAGVLLGSNRVGVGLAETSYFTKAFLLMFHGKTT